MNCLISRWGSQEICPTWNIYAGLTFFLVGLPGNQWVDSKLAAKVWRKYVVFWTGNFTKFSPIFWVRMISDLNTATKHYNNNDDRIEDVNIHCICFTTISKMWNAYYKTNRMASCDVIGLFVRLYIFTYAHALRHPIQQTLNLWLLVMVFWWYCPECQ